MEERIGRSRNLDSCDVSERKGGRAKPLSFFPLSLSLFLWGNFFSVSSQRDQRPTTGTENKSWFSCWSILTFTHNSLHFSLLSLYVHSLALPPSENEKDSLRGSEITGHDLHRVLTSLAHSCSVFLTHGMKTLSLSLSRSLLEKERRTRTREKPLTWNDMRVLEQLEWDVPISSLFLLTSIISLTFRFSFSHLRLSTCPSFCLWIHWNSKTFEHSFCSTDSFSCYFSSNPPPPSFPFPSHSPSVSEEKKKG